MRVRCPLCRKAVEWNTNPWRPFCSERCKMIDLGAWASEDYFIPATKDDEEDETGAGHGTKEDMKTW